MMVLRPPCIRAVDGGHFVAMRSLLIGFTLGVWFAVPWVAAAMWIGRRVGWRALLTENGEAFPSQAKNLRSFSLR
jgi:hypothetical protein